MIKFYSDTAEDAVILSVAGMRAAEQAAIGRGVASAALMERAGVAVAAAAARDQPAGTRMAVLAGPGNNGGDGYVAARVLADRGHEVRVFATPLAAKGTRDAQAMARRWHGPIEPAQADALARFAPAVIVDALFGLGLSRAPSPDLAALIEAANALGRAGARIVAVDLPSGFPGDGGGAPGAAIEATATVTFHALKPVHALYPARAACGDIVIADIGLEPTADAAWRVNGRPADLARTHRPQAHKYDHGHVLVLAGGIEGIGAPRLSARSALRAGAGLVTLGVPAAAMPAHAARGPDALMLRQADGPDGLRALLEDRRRNAVVIGPAHGVGAETAAAVAIVLAADRRVVLDADALTSFAGEATRLAGLIRSAKGDAVVTPHEGEFAALFHRMDADAPAAALPGRPKLERALAAAAFLGAIVVLKGADTVIAAPDGRARINLNAPPFLATAGSGDVLAGIIAGRLAQGIEAFEAAAGAVWLHGEAGRLAGRGLIADDLPEALARVLAALPG